MALKVKNAKKNLSQSLYDLNIVTIHIEKNFAQLLLDNLTSGKLAVDTRYKHGNSISGDQNLDLPITYFIQVLTESLSNLENYETQRKQNETQSETLES